MVWLPTQLSHGLNRMQLTRKLGIQRANQSCLLKTKTVRCEGSSKASLHLDAGCYMRDCNLQCTSLSFFVLTFDGAEPRVLSNDCRFSEHLTIYRLRFASGMPIWRSDLL